MIYAVFALMGAVIIYQGVTLYYLTKEHNRNVEGLQSAWKDERQQLLDRIQAPSFEHYKQAEVKVIKAQKDDPPKTVLEVV